MPKSISKSYSFLVLAIISFFCVFCISVSAAPQSISIGYKTVTTIKTGSIVSLDTSTQGEIIPANTINEQHLVGVTISEQQSLLAVNDATDTTQVVSEGVAETLVSTVNGSISIGSQIGVSPLSGVGARAIAGSKVVGTAESSFSSSTSGAISENIYDISGNKHKIYIGYVLVLIAVGSANNNIVNTGFLNSLHNFVSNITGHTVSTTGLLLVFVIVIVAFISIVVLIYSAISGGLVSIGRNPLAKTSILTSLIQIFAMVLIIAAVSVTIIYFILR